MVSIDIVPCEPSAGNSVKNPYVKLSPSTSVHKSEKDFGVSSFVVTTTRLAIGLSFTGNISIKKTVESLNPSESVAVTVIVSVVPLWFNVVASIVISLE